MDTNMEIQAEESSEAKMKQMKDFSAAVTELVPRVSSRVLAQPTLERLKEGVEEMLALEKKARLAMDVPSTVKVATAIVKLCFESKHFAALNENILLLSKRRAQLQKVIKVVIITAIDYIDQTGSDATKKELLQTLLTVSAGKMFVELERARMTQTLSEMEEKAGNLTEAADLLNEIQVETIGSMDVTEKADILLEQIRLCLARKDYVRVEILTRKMKVEILEDPDEKMQQLKLKHYNLSIEYFTHVSDYLQICRAYRKIFSTPSVQEDEKKWRPALSNAVIYCLLSPYGSESADLMYRLKAEKKLEDLPTLKALVDDFTTDELMTWPLPGEADIRSGDAFADMDKGEERFERLHTRVIQHNLRICSLYYSEIQSERLAALVQLDVPAMEKYLSELITSQSLFARINRPAGVVSFVKRQNAHEILKSWSGDVDKVLNLIENTCHLIDKEMTMGKVQA